MRIQLKMDMYMLFTTVYSSYIMRMHTAQKEFIYTPLNWLGNEPSVQFLVNHLASTLEYTQGRSSFTIGNGTT